MTAPRFPDETTTLALLVLAALLLGCASCIAYRAPIVSYQSGPENNYNQERSGNNNRSPGAEQQVADTTAAQNQWENATDTQQATALDVAKQIGLKQGQGTAGAATSGTDNTGATLNADQTQQGQAGGDAIGQTPTVHNAPGGNAHSPAAPITPAPTPEEPLPNP